MSRLKHTNLLAYGDKSDVYAALQRDLDRDTWIHLFWHAVFVVAALGSAFVANRPDWLWLFGGLYAVERAIARYVDNSNRNWSMHVIDWLEHTSASDVPPHD
jgi:hypothetical protein